MQDKMNRSLAIGDTVVVTSQFDWTPEGFNAGKVERFNTKNSFTGGSGNVDVTFGNGQTFTYHPSALIKVIGL